MAESVEEVETIQNRYAKEKEQIKVFAITKFAKDLLEVADNLGMPLLFTKISLMV